MILLQIILVVVLLGICFLGGIHWEKRRAKRIQDKIRLDLINVNFGMSLLPGETVEQLSERAKSYLRYPFKYAMENQIWIEKS